MNFIARSEDLLEMLKVATKGYDQRDTNSFVFFEVGEEKLTVTSQCQSAFFRGSTALTQLNYEEEESLSYYIDGETIKKLLTIFPSADIPIQFEINNKARVFTISYSGNSFKLPVVNDSMPVVTPETKELGTIQAEQFMGALGNLVKVVDTGSSSQSHPAGCLHLIFNGDKLTTMATDRFAIAELAYDFTSYDESLSSEPKTHLVKHTQANLLLKAFDQGEVLKILVSKEYIGYEDANGFISLVGLTDFTPLNYTGLKSRAGTDFGITLKGEHLRQALSTISKISMSNVAVLNVDGGAKTATISSSSGDTVALAVQSFDVEGTKEISFTRSVVQEALAPVETEFLTISWAENPENHMYKITPLKDDLTTAVEDIFVGFAGIVSV